MFQAYDGTPHLPSLYTLVTFPDNIICAIVIYADDATLYSKCDQASDLW